MNGDFICYAHRGASEYCPENTLVSFYAGICLGANGIETDVRLTKDGVPVLFHDSTLKRLAGVDLPVAELTFDELQAYTFVKNGIADKIVSLDTFLRLFAFRDIKFAIELKAPGTEEKTAELIEKYGIRDKCVVTSFDFDKVRRMKEILPTIGIGLLVREHSPETLRELKEIGGTELCPNAETLTPEETAELHKAGFRVRAWGVKTEALMLHALACGADGMTVNFPDKLVKLMKNKNDQN